MINRTTARATAVFLALSFFVACADYALTRIADASKRELLAVLIGGAATIFAGWLAWDSVAAQAERQASESLARATARKEDAVLAITQPVHAAAAWLVALRRDLESGGDRDGKSLRAKRNARRLDQVLDRDLVLALISEMTADDRANLLMIMGTMRTALAVAQAYSDSEVLSGDDLTVIMNALTSLGAHLARFDDDLRQSFMRDTGI